ncbi:GNAT family N-acetyltransferase [Occallatibacter riparius]|uniref:GNAT family N-acetyltransferase n=1 Tax=Occallatibacter riparius TaxID=1002689 RepID=A0A9J7BPX6_9BACT|nr:N-acetyltransferase [Occallatibacter riparius]UWZ84760.1 GNAT family N-acetyltransferase [Occallatibacter riparius]
MTSGVSLEILDLRHFSASLLRPLLESEGEVWRVRLNWDYATSARLLLQYLDSRMLPGYAALENGRVTGYAFCVYEETKAVIGDVFAVDGEPGYGAKPVPPQTAAEIEHRLLTHLFETLQHSPQVDRIESQLLLHPSGDHADVFREAEFTLYRRLFMVQDLSAAHIERRREAQPDLEIRPWRDDDLSPAGRLISEAYADHPDSLINDQYRSSHGSMRFLHNIVRYSGCGTFAPQVSFVICDRHTREMVALVLGSRVSADSGHITQLCVKPRYRRRGLARTLLTLASSGFSRLDMREVSLTVTEANQRAIELYKSEGYTCRHMFDAAVWQRPRMA